MADSVIFDMAVDFTKLRTGLYQSVGLVTGTDGRIERAFGALSNPIQLFADLGIAVRDFSGNVRDAGSAARVAVLVASGAQVGVGQTAVPGPGQ